MWFKRLRSDRVVVLVVAVLLALASVLYYIIQRGKLGPADARLATDKTLIMSLAATLLVLAIALAWVLVRSLTRVLAARRRGVIGSRLQTKLAFSFLFLVFIPSLILFGGAIALVTRALKDVGAPELADSYRVSHRLAETYLDRSREEAANAARTLSESLGPTDVPQSVLARRLARWRETLGVSAVGVIPEQGVPVMVADLGDSGDAAAESTDLGRLPARWAEEAAGLGALRLTEERLDYGWQVAALMPVLSDNGRAVIWASQYIGEDQVRLVESAKRPLDELQSFRSRRPALQRLYVVVFALLTMLVLFGAVWTALYLARQITDPILEVSRATDALARGDLSYRVPEGAKDEVGHLAMRFNRMASEIEHQRSDIETRRRYIETLLQAVPVGVISLDSQAQVTTINAAALEALRLERVPAEQTLDTLLAGGRENLLPVIQPVLMRQTIAAEAEATLEVEGTKLSLEVTAQRFPVGPDEEEGVLIVLEDLTRLRRAERLAAWGEVARRVAHEIKNPLTPVRLAAERLLRRYRNDPVEAKDSIESGVQTIVREVVSLKSLVDEFSRFARLPEIRLERGNLNDVVREAVALYQGSDDHAVRIDTDLSDNMPDLRIDAEAMRRCVINLLENSVAAIAEIEDGRIQLRTTRTQQNGAIVAVEDNGPGLEEEDRQRLFLPTFSRRPGGTGLGLAIVHRIVTEHGGRVHAETRAEGGTRMVIEIPGVPDDAEPQGGWTRGPSERKESA